MVEGLHQMRTVVQPAHCAHLRAILFVVAMACTVAAVSEETWLEQDKIMQRFFETPEEESKLDFHLPADFPLGIKRVAGFAQPLNNVRGRLVLPTPDELRADSAICLRWDQVPRNPDPNAWECFHDRVVQYTWMQKFNSASGPSMMVKTCKDVHSAASKNYLAPFLPSPGCTFDFQPTEQEKVLLLNGPTLIVARSPHFPHWLEEISAALTWLAENDEIVFTNALVIGDTKHQACWSFQQYVTGSWAPNGSPLRETLQIQLLQTVAKNIIFSWGLRPERVTCFESPWVSPLSCRGVERCGGATTWGHPLAATHFRSRVSTMLHPDLSSSPRSEFKPPSYKVLVIQRFSGGRAVTNLHELLTREDVKKLPIEEMKFVSMGEGDFKSALQQTRAFLQADIVVAHHGSALALAPLLRRSSLVVEIFNYRTYCDCFDDLFGNLGLSWRRLFYQVYLCMYRYYYLHLLSGIYIHISISLPISLSIFMSCESIFISISVPVGFDFLFSSPVLQRALCCHSPYISA